MEGEHCPALLALGRRKFGEGQRREGVQKMSPALEVNVVMERLDGYWAGWSLTTRSCSKRTIDDVPVGSLTHLNLAFAYIEPGTFEIVPMPRTSDKVFSQITNLKQKAPGLKIWISLGGWTYSDNDTDTQAVWGDLSRTNANRYKFAANLHKFMKTWGFDGVDLDWEYPGAPDRGGKPDDPDNFVLLLETLNTVFAEAGSDFGISFTAPSSYWYLRWFKIDLLWKYVSWINLMSYDLHGSWDAPGTYIGPYVYAHTNKTEIKESLDLFWRMGVPADRINLGIGFYGRSYTLEDANCNKPGCPHSAPGVAGQCTGEGGILSFAEIESYIKRFNLEKIHDKEAGVKYLAWGSNNQWVSYDDEETLQDKVDFAKEQGLLGLFVWSIDLDDTDHTALKALLGGKLDIFADQNGYNPSAIDQGNFASATGTECKWSSCGTTSCGAGYQSAGAQQYCGMRDGKAQRQTLCCPLKSTPDPKKCRWSGGQQGVEGFWCSGTCRDGEIPVVSSTEPYIDDEHLSCWFGFAQYCCESSTGGINDVCGWTSECLDLKNGRPANSNTLKGVCGDRNFVTTKRGTCQGNKGVSFCCDKGIDTSSCYWNEGGDFPICSNSEFCSSTTSKIDQDQYGGPNGDGKGDSTHECKYTIPQQQGIWSWYNADLAFCCNTKGMGKETINLPVPLKNLFPTPGPDSNTEKLYIKIDQTMGGQITPGNSNDPDDHAFGFYIMSGPEEEITTVNKRDGSHWELFDCDNTISENRQTVKAVCTDSSANSNCDIIFKGGLEHTVVEMPSDCGPGKYAVARKMELSTTHTHIRHKLEKRGLADALVYDFTFDYDFTTFEKRAGQSNVLVRIDYSDNPGYWDSIIEAPPGNQKRKRDLEIETIFGGNKKAWLEHTWRKEKRELHYTELHKRWWSGNVKEWWDKQRDVDIKYQGVRHRVKEQFNIKIFEETLKDCAEWADDLYFKSWVEMDLDVQTAAGVTVIGKLGNLESFEESSAWFRTEGQVTAQLKFEAFGKVSFHTGNVELFGAHNFGATFRVPGFVTIGPDFRIIGSLAGEAQLKINATYEMKFPGWDYSMRYPIADGEDDKPDEETPKKDVSGSGVHDKFTWDLDASGKVTAHIIPKVTFGIVFDSSAISNAALDLGIDSYAQLYADTKVGSNQPFIYCYGMDAGAELFGNIEAPTVFKTRWSKHYTLWNDEYAVIPRYCSDGWETPYPFPLSLQSALSDRPNLRLTYINNDREGYSMDKAILSSTHLEHLEFTALAIQPQAVCFSEMCELKRCLLQARNLKKLCLRVGVASGAQNDDYQESPLNLPFRGDDTFPALEELTLDPMLQNYFPTVEHCEIWSRCMDWGHLNTLDFGSGTPTALLQALTGRVAQLKTLKFGFWNDYGAASGLWNSSNNTKVLERFIDSIDALRNVKMHSLDDEAMQKVRPTLLAKHGRSLWSLQAEYAKSVAWEPEHFYALAETAQTIKILRLPMKVEKKQGNESLSVWPDEKATQKRWAMARLKKLFSSFSQQKHGISPGIALGSAARRSIHSALTSLRHLRQLYLKVYLEYNSYQLISYPDPDAWGSPQIKQKAARDLMLRLWHDFGHNSALEQIEVTFVSPGGSTKIWYCTVFRKWEKRASDGIWKSKVEVEMREEGRDYDPSTFDPFG
ncbi:hypothetical protein J3E71DRAFT_358329 [Bipolaris maydis]|nr:hypothetical protein J3E71DRAFT_358329 [Bipolaris maydis]